MKQTLKNTDDDSLWKLIESINWVRITAQVRHNDEPLGAIDFINEAAEKLKRDYSIQNIQRARDFAKLKRAHLTKVMNDYALSQGSIGYYGVSDDGFWDLTAQIVGMGKQFYYLVLNKPNLALIIKVVENFEYVFTKALPPNPRANQA